MLRPTWIDDGSPIPDPFGFGERAVEWLRRRKHPKAASGRFDLNPITERMVRAIEGPRHPDKSRIVKEVFLGLPRGNRKTSISAALALLHLCGPEEVPGSHLVSAASTRKQAREAFEEAAMIVATERKWRKHLRIADHKNAIRFPRRRSRYEAVSSDAGGAHGMTLSFALVDELHAHRSPHLWEAIRTGVDKVHNSLLVVATTAGAGTENICFERWQYACAVQRGEIEDPAFLPIIFAMEEGDDWRDETLWHAVNPGLAYGYPPLDAMRRHAKEAETAPGSRRSFLQYRLNNWQQYSETPFVDMSVYDLGANEIKFDALKEQPCWLGIDLSQVYDMTCIVACWKDDKGGYIVRPWFFLPEQQLIKREAAGYTKWKDAGFLETTPGSAIDYAVFHRRLEEICGELNVQQIGVDPKGANPTLNALMNKGLPVFQFSQANGSMCPAIHELERAIVAGQFQHGGNPVLRWNFENIRTVPTMDGYKRFHKGKSKDKIDGAVAAAMAIKLVFDSDNPGLARDSVELIRDFYK